MELTNWHACCLQGMRFLYHQWRLAALFASTDYEWVFSSILPTIYLIVSIFITRFTSLVFLPDWNNHPEQGVVFLLKHKFWLKGPDKGCHTQLSPTNFVSSIDWRFFFLMSAWKYYFNIVLYHCIKYENLYHCFFFFFHNSSYIPSSLDTLVD